MARCRARLPPLPPELPPDPVVAADLLEAVGESDAVEVAVGEAVDCGDAVECVAMGPDNDDDDDEPADVGRSGDVNAAAAKLAVVEEEDEDEDEDEGGDMMTACATSIAICPFGVHFFCAE